MAYRTLELNLISAQDLNDVNLFSKMEIYAVASIEGDPRSRQRTASDHNGGRSPAWNSTHRFSIPNADPNRAVLHVLLRCERALGDRDVGEVHIPLKELLDGSAAAKSPSTFVSYQVRKVSSGKAKGVLNISYKFLDPVPVQAPTKIAENKPMAYTAVAPGNGSKTDGPPMAYPSPYPPPAKAAKADEPVTAYPAGPSTAYPPPGSGAPHAQPYYPGAQPQGYPGAQPQGYPGAQPQGYPGGQPQGYPGAQPQGYPGAQQPQGYSGAPPAGYGYPQQPQAGYGYPQQPQAGYGYPPAGYGYGAAQPAMMAQPPKKNKMGMGLGAGLGAGLLGGAIGGLLIGDLVSDNADYDGGYDGGFDDGGGFDF